MPYIFKCSIQRKSLTNDSNNYICTKYYKGTSIDSLWKFIIKRYNKNKKYICADINYEYDFCEYIIMLISKHINDTKCKLNCKLLEELYDKYKHHENNNFTYILSIEI